MNVKVVKITFPIENKGTKSIFDKLELKIKPSTFMAESKRSKVRIASEVS